jgi:lipoic acid synthetase
MALVQLSPPGRKREPKPEWLRVPLPGGERYRSVRDTLKRLKLHTVCEEAQCPNVGECWGGGTATVMLMGDVCTRGCRFCDVNSGTPKALDTEEPQHLAEAVRELGLDYIVVTSVNRDDLEDGGAGHFAEAIRAMKREAPKMLVEVLIPDFQGSHSALDAIIDAGPDVVAHNIETVRSLTRKVRDIRATYDQSMAVLAYLKQHGARVTKSSIQIGHGEPAAEVSETMRDLRANGVDIVTLGQYLRPSPKHLPVVEWVNPERFQAWEEEARSLGFLFAASGPLVRSSYRAGELFLKGHLQGENVVSNSAVTVSV